MSNVTSIYGYPRYIAGIPSNIKLPSKLLSLTIARSPSYIEILVYVYPSYTVLNVFVFLTGI